MCDWQTGTEKQKTVVQMIWNSWYRAEGVAEIWAREIWAEMQVSDPRALSNIPEGIPGLNWDQARIGIPACSRGNMK